MHLAGNPRVVDHYIESSETVSSSLDNGADILGHRDVNVLEPSPRSVFAGQLFTVAVVEICDDDLGAGIDECLHYSTTEPRRAAGDDSDPVD